MKIAHVIHSLWSGGAETIVLGLARESALAGHTVEVIRLDAPLGTVYEAAAIESFQKLGIATCSLGRKPGSSLRGMTTAAKLWWLAQTRQFDIMHSHVNLPDALTGLVKQLTPGGFDHVLTVHSTREVRSNIYKFLCGRPTVVYCSRASEKGSDLKARRSAIIPNGVALGRCRYSESTRKALRSSLRLSDSAFAVISVGNLRPGKNYECAIDGMAGNREILAEANIHYLICGDGSEGPRLKARVKELGLEDRIHFLGVRTDIPELLSAADLFLSTSLFEGMPLSVLEALAASLPCLLSPLEEHREITGGMQFVQFLDENTPEAVGKGLQSAIGNRPNRASLSSLRAPGLEPFEIAHCAGAYLALYQELRTARPGMSKSLAAENSSGQ